MTHYSKFEEARANAEKRFVERRWDVTGICPPGNTSDMLHLARKRRIALLLGQLQEEINKL